MLFAICEVKSSRCWALETEQLPEGMPRSRRRLVCPGFWSGSSVGGSLVQLCSPSCKPSQTIVKFVLYNYQITNQLQVPSCLWMFWGSWGARCFGSAVALKLERQTVELVWDKLTCHPACNRHSQRDCQTRSTGKKDRSLTGCFRNHKQLETSKFFKRGHYVLCCEYWLRFLVLDFSNLNLVT